MNVISMPLRAGGSIMVQSLPIETGTELGGPELKDQMESARKNIEESLGDLEPLGSEIKKRFSQSDSRPNKLEFEVGVSFTGKGSLVLCSLEGGATFKIKMEWDLSQEITA